MNTPTDYIFRARMREIEDQITLGQYKSAESLLAALDKELPGHPGVLKLRGLICEKSDRVGEAIRLYKKSIVIAPEFDIALQLARLYEGQGDYRSAMIYLDIAEDLYPLIPTAAYRRGCIWAKQGAFDLATNEFNRAIDLLPYWSLPYLAIGEILAIQGDRTEICRFFEKALLVLHNEQMVIEAFASVLERRGYYDIAADQYRELSRQNPSEPEYWFRLGRCLSLGSAVNTDQYQEALDAMTFATNLAPTNAHYYLILSGWLMRLGKLSLARSAYNKAIRNRPSLLRWERSSSPIRPLHHGLKNLCLNGAFWIIGNVAIVQRRFRRQLRIKCATRRRARPMTTPTA